MTNPLISAEELVVALGNPDLKIVDASWHMPAAGRDPYAEFLQAHIPGAVFFDLDKHSDHSTSLPHMLPAPETFGKAVSELGISQEHLVVIYDTAGLFSAARLWWMFRAFGYPFVTVLDGGFPKWRAADYPVESGETDIIPHVFEARFDPAPVRDKNYMVRNLTEKNAHVIDARGPGRFSGTEKDPRPGVRPGHIPGSRNLHYATLLNEDGTLKNRQELRHLLEEAGVDYHHPVVSTCGSGVTACILDLALAITHHPNHAVYDGSWAEWGADAELPSEVFFPHPARE